MSRFDWAVSFMRIIVWEIIINMKETSANVLQRISAFSPTVLSRSVLIFVFLFQAAHILSIGPDYVCWPTARSVSVKNSQKWKS